MSADIQQTEYGPFSSKLLCSKLSDLCVQNVGVQTGPFGTQLHKEDYVDVGTPIITVEHLGENRIVHGDTPLVSDADKSRLSKYQLLEGDIVFSRVGSVDRCALVRKEEDGWLFSGRCLRVRVDKTKLAPVYLSYFFGLEGFKKYIRGIAVGATMPSINTKILSNIPIYYPEDLKEQKRIANIFYTNDDKIELNRQTNQTLEHIAQALFKCWFVDFEPTRAKIIAKEKGANTAIQELAAQAIICGAMTLEQLEAITQNLETTLQQAINEKLNQANQTPINTEQLKTTAALFPNALVESELGEIPEGWEVGVVGDLFELHRGFDLPKKDRKDGAYSVFAAGGYHGQHAEFKMEPPGIITGRSGVIGNVYLSLEKYWPLNTTLYVREFKKCGPYYAYFYLLGCDLKAINSGSAVPSLNRNFVHSLTCSIPGSDLLYEFEQVLTASFKKIKLNEDESEKLSVIRDVLLPKLLSGVVDLNGVDE